MNQYVWVSISEALNRASERTLNSCAHKSHKEDMICIISLVINRMFDRSKHEEERMYLGPWFSEYSLSWQGRYGSRYRWAHGTRLTPNISVDQEAKCLGQKWHYVYSSRLTFQWPSRLHFLKVPRFPKTAPPLGTKYSNTCNCGRYFIFKEWQNLNNHW